jgi:hypothetical protein
MLADLSVLIRPTSRTPFRSMGWSAKKQLRVADDSDVGRYLIDTTAYLKLVTALAGGVTPQRNGSLKAQSRSLPLPQMEMRSACL